MTGPSPDSFQRALNTFKQSLSPTLTRQFSICTLQDVKTAIRDIQKKEGQAQDGRLRNMARLRAFIEAMDQFGQVVEVFLNANEFVCFIWGPIKFILNIARAHLESFDKLLDAYSQIGDAIPGLLAYKTTFERHHTLAAVLEDYYSDILRFHQEALEVFNRNRWKKFFDATWKTFDSRFGPILQSLASRRELLESEKASACLYEIQSVRESIEKVYKEQTRQATEMNISKHESKIARIKQRLRVSDYQMDQIIPTNVKYRIGNASGQWIFKNAKFLSWSDRTSPGHRVLYVNGIPGAGKTTLMSTVIEKLFNEMQAEGGSTRTLVAYFYFKHGQKNKNNHNDFLRALLAQLVDRNIVMSEQLYNDLSSAAEEKLRSTESLEARIKEAFESFESIFLVVDGLDACEREEAGCTVEWLLSLVNDGSETSNTSLRFIISGQRDGVLDKILANQPSIALESSQQHLEDIIQYCQTFVRENQRKARFQINPELEGKIVTLVTEEAKGMFLYARVVLENLLRQTSIGRLKRELRPGTFPRGLEAAYERVIVRVVEESSDAEREDAMTVLSLVLCAKRALRWQEIQAFFCIMPEDGEVDYDRFLRVDYKELCGALLDAHQVDNGSPGPEDIIQIVHETARGYIRDRKLLDLNLGNAKLAIFCTEYLGSGPFSVGVNQDDILSHAKQGYFSFQDYAVQYWFEHLSQCFEFSQAIDSALLGTSIGLAKRFLDSYCLEDKMDKQYDTASCSQVVEAIKSLPKDGRERNSHLNIELRTFCIRQQIAKLRHEVLAPETGEMLTNLYGPMGTYKCPKPWCELFKGGLGTAEKWKQHVNHHELPFYCPWEGCFAAKLGFPSESNLEKHTKDHHAEKKDQLDFLRNHAKKGPNLCSAAKKGNLEAVENALDAGEDINQTTKPRGSQTPLFLAASNGHVRVCKLLLSRGADITLRDRDLSSSQQNALEAAASTGRADVVSLLLEQRPHDVEVRSSLVSAARKGYLDVARALLESGKIDCNADENRGVLRDAVVSGNENLVQYLLQNGFEFQADESCLDAAVETLAARPVLGLLLCTGRPVIASSRAIEKSLDESWLPLAKMLISYPKLRLKKSDLQRCLSKMEGKKGFDEIVDAIRALLAAKPNPQAAPDIMDSQMGQQGQGQQSQGERPQGQPPPMYKPAQIRRLPTLSDEEKSKYEQGLQGLWNKAKGSPQNSPENIAARQKIIEFSKKLITKIQQRRAAHHRMQMQLQQQQQQGQPQQAAAGQATPQSQPQQQAMGAAATLAANASASTPSPQAHHEDPAT